MSENIYAEIITIGDEILYGQITNTNSRFISAELDSAGFRTIRQTSVGDSESEILKSLAEAETRAQVIVLTGGLGPTRDDITKNTLAKYFNSEMVVNTSAQEELRTFLEYRGRTLSGLNQFQAVLPKACRHMSNRIGTAPGMWFDKGDKVILSMPGVPAEMKEMLTMQALPRLKERYHTPTIYHKIIRTAGIPETFLAEKIEDWENALPEHIRLAYLPSFGGVKLRLTATGPDINVLKAETEELTKQLRPLAGDYIFAEEDTELEKVVATMLENNRQMLSVAESCTGGSLAALLTAMPGSSEWFSGAAVTYSVESKIKVLGINADTIAKHTVYSLEVAAEMAQNVRALYGTDFGLATTGVAGPPRPEDVVPAGTIFIAVAHADGVETKQLKLGTEREINIKMTNLNVMNMLRHKLLAEDREKK
ncbi:MAG: competence/damage-inducible protein A [Bacteroidota bacterium]